MAGGGVSLEQCQGWLMSRQFARALTAADDALSSPRLEKEERIEWLRLKAVALSSANPHWVGRAASCVHEALELAQDASAMQVRLLATLAPIYAEGGDYRRVHRVLQQFLLLALRHPTKEVTRWAGHIRFNLALCYETNPDRLAEAVRTYRQAVADWESAAGCFPDPMLQALVASGLHNLSGVLLRLGHVNQAKTAADQAARGLAPDIWGAKVLNRQAELHLALGDPAAAVGTVSQAAAHPSLENDDVTRADILFTWARAELLLGNTAAAHAKAVQALDLAMRRGYARLIDQVLAFLQQPPLEGMEVSL